MRCDNVSTRKEDTLRNLRVACLLMGWLLAGCSGGPSRHSAGTSAPASRPAGSTLAHLSPLEAREFLSSHANALVLDVRNPDEWNDDLGHLPGARLIPLPELERRMTEIAAWKDRPVLVVCRVGGRSARAGELLVGAGFRTVMNLDGGMLAWRETEGLPKRR